MGLAGVGSVGEYAVEGSSAGEGAVEDSALGEKSCGRARARAGRKAESGIPNVNIARLSVSASRVYICDDSRAGPWSAEHGRGHEA